MDRLTAGELDLPLSHLKARRILTAPSAFPIVGMAFDGLAHSVDFSGPPTKIGFDNITLGSERPIGRAGGPEPGSLPLLSASRRTGLPPDGKAVL